MKILEPLGTASRSNSVSTARRDPIDVSELMERVAGDIALLGHLVEIFFRDYESCETSMKTAIQQADSEALQKWAHRLKGALGNFAAHSAFEYASKLEQCGIDSNFQSAEDLLRKLNNEVDQVREKLTSLLTPNS